jgi:hypothetical protein
MSIAPEAALAEILTSTGVPAEIASNARLVGDDPVIPTRYRIGAAGSAVIAAAGLAAASLWNYAPAACRTSRSTFALPPRRCAARDI